MMPAEDHDLLVRIDEQVKQMRISFEADRAQTAAREAKRDTEFENFKTETRKRFEVNEAEIGGLKMSRVQLIAIATTIAAIVSFAVKLWKG